MLYIEASQINSNGGIVLLDLLLRRIKERNINAIIYIGYGHVLNRPLIPQHYYKIFFLST